MSESIFMKVCGSFMIVYARKQICIVCVGVYVCGDRNRCRFKQKQCCMCVCVAVSQHRER